MAEPFQRNHFAIEESDISGEPPTLLRASECRAKLDRGAIVVVEETHYRVRRLPIQ